MKNVLKQVAKNNNTTVGEVRREINKAINEGMNSPDPQVRAMWKSMSKNGGTPTAEEAVAYLSSAARNRYIMK